jgi:tripartite-type tricarboxylate transporter receptor subunit TctC
VQRGSLRALAIAGTQRATALPDTATFAEQGFDDAVFKTRVWMALLAPARTPAALIERVQREVRAVLHESPVRADLIARGFEPSGNTPSEFGAALTRDHDVLTALIRRIGITPQ